MSIQQQVLTLEYFDENDEIRSETFECNIENSTVIRLSHIHQEVQKRILIHIEHIFNIVFSLAEDLN